MANTKKDKIRAEIVKLRIQKGYTYKAIAEIINKKFGTDFPDRQWIYYYVKSNRNK